MNRPFTLALLAVAMLVATRASQAASITYVATLNGANESPPNMMPGTGSATVIVNTVAQTMEVIVNFSGLSGTGGIAAHIHSATAIPGVGTAGVATTVPAFPGFPLGQTSGSYDGILDLTSAASYNPAFVTAQGGIPQAETAFLAGMAAGENYLNIHTNAIPGGEIRGFLTQAIPEPASIVMLGSGVLGVIAFGLHRAARTRT